MGEEISKGIRLPVIEFKVFGGFLMITAQGVIRLEPNKPEEALAFLTCSKPPTSGLEFGKALGVEGDNIRKAANRGADYLVKLLLGKNPKSKLPKNQWWMRGEYIKTKNTPQYMLKGSTEGGEIQISRHISSQALKFWQKVAEASEAREMAKEANAVAEQARRKKDLAGEAEQIKKTKEQNDKEANYLREAIGLYEEAVKDGPLLKGYERWAWVEDKREELDKAYDAAKKRLRELAVPALPMIREPVKDFVGRQKDIDSLVECLCEDNSISGCCIIGMGGIGKTELALVVASRLREKFPIQILIEMQTSTPQSQPDNSVERVRSFL